MNKPIATLLLFLFVFTTILIPKKSEACVFYVCLIVDPDKWKGWLTDELEDSAKHAWIVFQAELEVELKSKLTDKLMQEMNKVANNEVSRMSDSMFNNQNKEASAESQSHKHACDVVGKSQAMKEGVERFDSKVYQYSLAKQQNTINTEGQIEEIIRNSSSTVSTIKRGMGITEVNNRAILMGGYQTPIAELPVPSTSTDSANARFSKSIAKRLFDEAMRYQFFQNGLMIGDDDSTFNQMDDTVEMFFGGEDSFMLDYAVNNRGDDAGFAPDEDSALSELSAQRSLWGQKIITESLRLKQDYEKLIVDLDREVTLAFSLQKARDLLKNKLRKGKKL